MCAAKIAASRQGRKTCKSSEREEENGSGDEGWEMTETIQVALSVGMPTLAVLIGTLVNNSRLTDIRVQLTELRIHIDQRITDTKETLRADLRRVEEVLDARLSDVEREIHKR